MNSVADILSQTADELFPSAAAPPVSIAQADALRSAMYAMKNQLDAMLRILSGASSAFPAPIETLLPGERVIPGAFTGEKMRGDDGKEYAVPQNYANKSKLVSGDRMKLTITKSGSCIYKQICPVERRRIIGELIQDHGSLQWSVRASGKPYKVLTASVTFYKGKSGDEAILLLPRDRESDWGAVENIISA